MLFLLGMLPTVFKELEAMLLNGLKMCEYKAYWLTGVPVGHVLRNNYGVLLSKQTNKYKEKILWPILTVVIKSKETRVVTYTYRYSSGYLFPIIQSC